ncbi:hypothetical protein BH09BAC4_BH09BAC4_05210 [soil metagenome]
MSILKLVTLTNWILISIWTLLVIYSLLQPNGSTDAAGSGIESTIKGLMVFVLLVLVGLNWLPYTWTKSVALLLEILFLLLVYYIRMN